MERQPGAILQQRDHGRRFGVVLLFPHALRRHGTERDTHDGVGHATTVAVGNVGQRDECGLTVERIDLLGRIANGEDAGVARSVDIIDRNATA